jgi:citronellol/citronellal dehydrogenase
MMAKFGMTLCALGIAEEMRDAGIASNTLRPRTLVATAAVHGGPVHASALFGGEIAIRGLTIGLWLMASHPNAAPPISRYPQNSTLPAPTRSIRSPTPSRTSAALERSAP